MANEANCSVFIVTTIVVCLLASVVGFVMIDCAINKPWYSAVIDSVTGLDPATDLARPSLDPLFNLTLCVASPSHMLTQYIEPGTNVEVTYHGVLLASGPAHRLCAGPLKVPRGQAVITRGHGVRVPGFVLDRLAEDMRRGVGSFDVTLTMPPTHKSNHGALVSCRPRRIGDIAALQTPCDASNIDIMWA
ncbi:hypothetical protein VPH35_019518 [Triticum aestivum]